MTRMQFRSVRGSMATTFRLACLVLGTLSVSGTACKTDPEISVADDPAAGTPAPSAGKGDGGAATGRAPDVGFTFTPPAPGATPPPAAPNACPTSGPDDDNDKDGYTVRAGDCNDCDKAVNPGAIDVPGNMIDEDCSGVADDEPANCDMGLPEDGDAVLAARALGICRSAKPDAMGKERTWGLVRASYVFPDGTTGGIRGNRGECGNVGAPPNPLSHGVLPLFGAVKPRAGGSIVALSSGVARAGENLVPSGGTRPSPEGATMCTHSTPPMGFPVSSYSTCGDIEDDPTTANQPVNANDAIALEMVIRVPTNAAALSFDFDFYTYEYNQYICSQFNDAFVALLYSKAPDVPKDHNIAFDSQGNPVSVNNGFLEVCAPFTYIGTQNGKNFFRDFTCKLGTKELTGTGFERRAATGWLQTRSNVVPGEEITLRFGIWDTGDSILDSTVLLDNFKWEATAGSTMTVRPPPIE